MPVGVVNNCKKFIELVSRCPKEITPTTEAVQNITALASKICKYKTTTTNSQALKNLKNRITPLSTSSEAINKSIKDVSQKLDDFIGPALKPSVDPKPPAVDPQPPIIIEDDEEPLAPPPPAAPSTVRGIQNTGGNDCFLIALCQMLKVEGLRKYLADQLPDELWKTFVAENLNSQAVRAAIVRWTNFANLINASHDPSKPRLDPMRSQLDPTEVLTALLEAIDRTPPATPAPATPAPATPAPATPAPATPAPATPLSRWAKLCAFVANIFHKLHQWLYTLYCNITGTTSENSSPILFTPPSPPPNYSPNVPNNVIEKRTPHITFKENPLTIPTNHKTERFVDWDRTQPITPTEAYEAVNVTPHAERGEKLITLTVLQDKSFKEMFAESFASETIDNRQDPLEQNQHVIVKSAEISAFPEYMLLSLKRFSFTDGTAKKISTPVDIPLAWQLPEVTLEKSLQQQTSANTYSLSTFLVHLGSSPNSGHYVSYRKEKDGWYYFNDGATPKKLIDAEVEKAAKDAFLVFYQRNKTTA